MFLSELPGYWFVVNRKPPYFKTGVTDFEYKGMTWYRNFQGWWSWEWRLMSIAEGWGIHWMTSLEHIGNTVMSWKHWPKTEVKVWWTIGVNEMSRWLPNPNTHWHGVKEVSCSRATCNHKEFLLIFPKFSSVICRPVPLYFLTRLRRIKFSLSIIQPFRWIKYCYLII